MRFSSTALPDLPRERSPGSPPADSALAGTPPQGHARHIGHLRLALFSGNYNCTRDGANQALNRLVAFLERHGAAVEVFSPTCATPAFAPAGRLTSVPSVAFPRRAEYRLAMPLPRRARAQLMAFRPNIVQISAPDILGCSAVGFAEKAGIARVASIHTRFDTYLRYYGLACAEPLARSYLRWLYNRCQQVYVPSRCMADILKAQGIQADIRHWGRGVDRDLFNPQRRDMAWRRSLGIADDAVIIAFVGRIVMEKGLAAFADAAEKLRGGGAAFRLLVVGDGPAAPWFRKRLPDAVFTGALSGTALATAFASADIFFNPSSTETFGNVNLEAMACGLPVVGARASGSSSLVTDGMTGLLVAPGDDAGVSGFAGALAHLIADAPVRRRLGAAGLAASRIYDWDEILGEVAGHYLQAPNLQTPDLRAKTPPPAAMPRRPAGRLLPVAVEAHPTFPNKRLLQMQHWEIVFRKAVPAA